MLLKIYLKYTLLKTALHLYCEIKVGWGREECRTHCARNKRSAVRREEERRGEEGRGEERRGEVR